MKSQALKQAWEIWILPLIILQAYITVTVTLFLALQNHIQSNDNAIDIAEEMLIFTLGSPFYAVMYYIMSKYEKVKQLKTRKFTKRGLQFLIIVHLILSILIFCERVIEVI